MSFGEYQLAMERKLEIAKWHASCLPGLVESEPDLLDLPPIELQAHFEGAGRALASIPDQLASGVCEILGTVVLSLPDVHAAYLHTTRNQLPEGSGVREVLHVFVTDPRYCDLRSWRNRATHRFDTKAMLDGMWRVAYPDDCPDPVLDRDLMAYVETMIDFGSGIIEEVPNAKRLASTLRNSLT